MGGYAPEAWSCPLNRVAHIIGGGYALWEGVAPPYAPLFQGGILRIPTAGLLFLETHKNNQFGKQPEGLQQFRDHRWKNLGEENSDLSVQFLFRHYFESYIE